MPVYGHRQLRDRLQSRGTLRQLEVATSLRYIRSVGFLSAHALSAHAPM